MKVVEIFSSIDGEGKRTGLPTTFIRLFGCNLNCSYCDTRYGCEGDNYTIMSVTEIVNKVKELGIPNITITGGEPLIHSGINSLLYELQEFNVNVETNGSQLISHPLGDVFYTMDYKCPSSGMEDSMNLYNLKRLLHYDVLKFVVGDTKDLDKMLEILEEYNPICQVYVSPVFGKIEPKEIVNYLLAHKLYDVKVQVQLHKIIWNPEERGV